MLQGATGFLAQATGHAPPPSETAASTPQPPAELVLYLFGLHWLPVTNTILTAWVVIIILVLFASLSTRNMQWLPSGVQNFWELIVELWVGVTEQTMGRRRGRRFLPLVVTAFLFILFSNWFGTLPISYLTIHNPEGEVVPIFRSADSDLNVTAAMAVLMIVLAEFFEVKTLGPLGYIKSLVFPNVMRWMEIFTRPLSLSVRLFGNIFAGEILLVTILNIAPYVMFVFIAIELFVGIIQALIFSMLSMVFLSIATMHEEGHGEHDGESLESEMAGVSQAQPV